jgi:hypothetical protein
MKDTHNLRLKFRKIDGEDETAGMEDEVGALGQQLDVPPQDVAHAALDAIPFMGFAQHLAYGETHAGSKWQLQWQARGNEARLLGRQKPTHGRRLPLAAGSIGALIIGVLPQTLAGKGLALEGVGRGAHE